MAVAPGILVKPLVGRRAGSATPQPLIGLYLGSEHLLLSPESIENLVAILVKISAEAVEAAALPETRDALLAVALPVGAA